MGNTDLEQFMGFDNTNDQYSLDELKSHLAGDIPLAREDDGFVGLDDVKPSTPDRALDFIHEHPAESMTLPVPGSMKVQRGISIGSQGYAARTIPLNKTYPVQRLCGRRRGRLKVSITVPVSTTFFYSADSEVNAPAVTAGALIPNAVRVDVPAGVSPYRFDIPTEAALWACVGLDSTGANIGVEEYFMENA